MQNPQQKDTAAATSAPKQDEHARSQPAREGEAVELSGEAVEERIAPRLSSNHNETFLSDR